MPTYHYLASECPAPQVPLAAHYKGADPPTPRTYGTIVAGAAGAVGLLTTSNRNAVCDELGWRYGGGAYAVLWGLDLQDGGGLTLRVTNGQAGLDGPAEVKQAAGYTTLALTDAVVNRIWISQGGSVNVVTAASASPLAPPDTATSWVYLGAVPTADGAITQIDYSGRLELRQGNQAHRRTADAGTPTDTPPAGVRFYQRSRNGLYLWDGERYWGTDDRSVVTLTPHRVTIPAHSANHRLQADFSAVGQFASPCYAVHCQSDEAGVIITHELNHTRAGVVSLMVFVPGDALPGTYGGALDLELIVTLEGKGWTGESTTDLAAVWSTPDPRDP